jgi:transcriptional regulator with XRE-family HTH domain
MITKHSLPNRHMVELPKVRTDRRHEPVLLRRVIGEVLRSRRSDQRRTLREVSATARVSLGYLSEVERGQKEASSELLAAICMALNVRLSDVLREVSIELGSVETRLSATDVVVAA